MTGAGMTRRILVMCQRGERAPASGAMVRVWALIEQYSLTEHLAHLFKNKSWVQAGTSKEGAHPRET